MNYINPLNIYVHHLYLNTVKEL